MIDIPCVIFAGGKSSRMKEDKALLPFAGFSTLTQYQYSRLCKIFTNVYISCKNKNKFDFQANYIQDIKTDNVFAPTVGFVSVFKKLNPDSFFAISVDAPFVSEKEINELVFRDKKSIDATIAKTEFGIEPMCGIYHRSLEKDFNKMLKDDNHKLGFLLKSSKTIFIHFKKEKNFLNLNNPDEYKEALQLI